MRKTKIVIPCYNESKRLDPTAFFAALEKDENLSFLFVNDGSTDETLAILTAIRAKRPLQVELLSLSRNSGKAEAVRCGMLAVCAGSSVYVGYWDADLATPLNAIDKFCNLLDKTDADLVIGSRVRLLGRKIERSAVRHYLGRIFATFTSLMLGIGIHDTQCGAKIFRNSDRLRQVFSSPFKVTWTFDVEMFARFPIVFGVSPRELSSRWVEYPLDEWVDVKGSKVGLKDYFRGGLEFLRLFFYLCTPLRQHYVKQITVN